MGLQYLKRGLKRIGRRALSIEMLFFVLKFYGDLRGRLVDKDKGILREIQSL